MIAELWSDASFVYSKFEITASWSRSVGVEGLLGGFKESLPVACGFVTRERRDTFLDRMIYGVLYVS